MKITNTYADYLGKHLDMFSLSICVWCLKSLESVSWTTLTDSICHCKFGFYGQPLKAMNYVFQKLWDEVYDSTVYGALIVSSVLHRSPWEQKSFHWTSTSSPLLQIHFNIVTLGNPFATHSKM